MKSSPTAETVGDYAAEHQTLYRHLISELPNETRRSWIRFIEETAAYALRRKPPLKAGSALPGFEAFLASLPPEHAQQAREAKTIIIAFSFGYRFPFCNLAFRHLYQEHETLKREKAKVLVLFPPEDSSPETTTKGFCTLPDPRGKTARMAGLRFPLPKEFLPLAKRIPWFPADHQTNPTPEITLPGTIILSPDGRVRFFDMPVDVTNRLAPSKIIETLSRLKSR
ncbi:MAG: hypothetical protein LAT55_07845 [Opitutales bacterium]|nr:hypothetical protein [Opitutales bacterium]